MDLYEQAQIYTAPQYLWQDDSKHSSEKITELFKRFIKEFRTNSVIFHYRDLLLSNLQKEIFSIEINQEDLINFDNTLAKVLCDKPSDSFPLVRFLINHYYVTLLNYFLYSLKKL